MVYLAIKGILHQAFTSSELPFPCTRGKVRDVYRLPEGQLLLVTTDRLSAFDRILGAAPFKGQVLNQLSAWWFDRTQDIIANHALKTPDPNVLVAVPASPFPVEVIVRGYITGVTSTALWYRYSLGERTIYGHRLPEGLRKNQALPQPLITPTTKGGSSGHVDLKAEGNILYLVGDFQPTMAGSHAVLAAPHDDQEDWIDSGLPPGKPVNAPLIYRLLHQAMRRGWVRSAHDLSEGGLAVSAAEMALAGRSGLSLDLSLLGKEPRLALFGETNGCLVVEVAPQAAPDFESLFQAIEISGGPACRRIGTVLSSEVFTISADGETLIDLPVSALVNAFLEPGKFSLTGRM